MLWSAEILPQAVAASPGARIFNPLGFKFLSLVQTGLGCHGDRRSETRGSSRRFRPEV